MKKVIFLTILALFACTGLFAQEKIAVFPFEDMEKILTKNEAILFYRNFTNEFTNKSKGSFSVVPRQEVEKLINIEAGFQLSDFSAKAKTAEMQRVLNGTQILSGVIGKFGSTLQISVSLYTYPELEQLPGGTDMSISSKDELLKKIPELVQNMLAELSGNRPAGGTYKIGDKGPAGGIIFFDRGFTGDGWRYLEAAPAGAEFTAYWGAYRKDVNGTGTAMGSGKQNTQIIVNRLKQLGESQCAAQICANLDINGYKDWFLPSKDELELMYKNLKAKGLGGFKNEPYWSSSQSRPSVVWYQRFRDDGYQGTESNLYVATFSVRAIRQF